MFVLSIMLPSKVVYTRRVLSSTVTHLLSSGAGFRSSLQPSWSPFIFAVEELYGTRYQSDSFSFIIVGSGFHCLRSFFFSRGLIYLLAKQSNAYCNVQLSLWSHSPLVNPFFCGTISLYRPMWHTFFQTPAEMPFEAYIVIVMQPYDLTLACIVQRGTTNSQYTWSPAVRVIECTIKNKSNRR